MALEIERRFLVVSDAWRQRAGPAQPLRQGYLAGSRDGVTVRLRLRDTAQGVAERAWLTLKAPTGGLARHEFDYGIPVDDAEVLWQLAPHRLTKTRFDLTCPGGDWVVDVFAAENAPLVLAEVELPAADAALELPPWCGRELTGDDRLSNAALAHKPLARWSREWRQSFDLL
jgi:adenylate cyclase